MRFAVTAIDRYLNIFQTLVERGWTPHSATHEENRTALNWGVWLQLQPRRVVISC